MQIQSAGSNPTPVHGASPGHGGPVLQAQSAWDFQSVPRRGVEAAGQSSWRTWPPEHPRHRDHGSQR